MGYATEFDLRYNPNYTVGMKTAISVPDQVAQSVDARAKSMGIARSQFYSEAAARYLKQLEDEELSAKLAVYYSKHPSKLLAAEWEATRQALLAVEWEE